MSIIAADGFRAAGVAAFEAAVLVRCTGVCGGGRARAPGGARARFASSATATGAERGYRGLEPVYVAEFNQLDAAQRLAELLGPAAGVITFTAGNRHRYDIHRVVATTDTEEGLRTAWQVGYAQLCASPTLPRSQRQLRHAMRLAVAAWRAALLVTGPTRSDSPGLRVPDLDTATALVRAGRMLDLPVRMNTRPGGQLLLVLPTGAPRVRLAEMAA